MSEGNPTGVRMRITGLGKSFGGVHALQEASLDLEYGEVLALVGENGAGKSTLLRSIAGAVTPDTGVIAVDGEDLTHLSRRSSIDHGIAIVPQELAFVPRMTVGEALALRGQKYHTRSGFIGWRALHVWAQGLLDEWELGIPSHEPMSRLTPAQHVAVSVLGALSLDARILILDEPTASFSPPETEHLFGIVRRLRSEGRSIIYVSHRLEEVLELSDRITVMREGRTVGTRATGEVTRRQLVEMIVGHDIGDQEPVAPGDPTGPIRMNVREVRRDRIGPVSFEIRAGEILGFAGLVGAGRTELFRMLFGLDQPDEGTVEIDGKPVRHRNPAQAVGRGITLVPEERRAAGIVPQMSIRENATLATLGRYAPVGVIDRRRQRADVNQVGRRVRLRASSIEAPVSSLSGGNQQKVVIARALSAGGDIMIFDEPTRGVDVGAKAEIFDLIREAAATGVAALVASSETEDLVGLCHRVIVMKEGTIVRELTGDSINAATISALCFGED